MGKTRDHAFAAIFTYFTSLLVVTSYYLNLVYPALIKKISLFLSLQENDTGYLTLEPLFMSFPTPDLSETLFMAQECALC